MKDNWISVNDSLPEDNSKVLVNEKWVYTPFIGWYCRKYKKWYLDTTYVEIIGDAYSEDNITQKDVTHWQPLPEPPEPK